MSSDVAISVRGLSKSYTIRHNQQRHTTLGEAMLHRLRHPFERAEREEFWALDDVSFDVKQGEVLGVIGRNGAGKSTLLKILSRITAPTKGEVHLYGRVGSLLEVGTGFHPELTGRENIYLNGSILGMRRREIDKRFDEIVDFAGIEQFLDTPVKRYSSGMYVRLAFAVAAHLDTDILLVDEVLAVGDSEFQKRCFGKMETAAQGGRTVLLVSHSMPTIARVCATALLLADGRPVAAGAARHVADTYATGPGSPATRVWRPAVPVGDEVARIREVRVQPNVQLPDGGVDIRAPVRISTEFEVLPPGQPRLPLASLILLRSDGEIIFGSNSHHAGDRRDGASGLYVATCTIPGNLLSEGRHIVKVMLNSDGYIHAAEEAALMFDVADPCLGDSVRGDYIGDWGGAVRPMLDWTVSTSAAPAPERP